MDINDIYGIIDKFDASGCSELNLEMNGDEWRMPWTEENNARSHM